MSNISKKNYPYIKYVAEYRALNSDQLTLLLAGTKRTVQNRIKSLLNKGLVTLIPENSIEKKRETVYRQQLW